MSVRFWEVSCSRLRRDAAHHVLPVAVGGAQTDAHRAASREPEARSGAADDAEVGGERAEDGASSECSPREGGLRAHARGVLPGPLQRVQPAAIDDDEGAAGCVHQLPEGAVREHVLRPAAADADAAQGQPRHLQRAGGSGEAEPAHVLQHRAAAAGPGHDPRPAGVRRVHVVARSGGGHPPGVPEREEVQPADALHRGVRDVAAEADGRGAGEDPRPRGAEPCDAERALLLVVPRVPVPAVRGEVPEVQSAGVRVRRRVPRAHPAERDVLHHPREEGAVLPEVLREEGGGHGQGGAEEPVRAEEERRGVPRVVDPV